MAKPVKASQNIKAVLEKAVVKPKPKPKPVKPQRRPKRQGK